jgi:hypothetical protein
MTPSDRQELRDAGIDLEFDVYTPPDREVLWMCRAMRMDREWRFAQTERGRRLALEHFDGSPAAMAVRLEAGIGLI